MLSQLILIPAMILLALTCGGTQRTFRREGTSPPLNNQPREVRPLHNYESVVTDEQLSNVLQKLRFTAVQQPKINHVDHALRMWGQPAKLRDDFLNGEQMVAMLTSDSAYRGWWGEKARPLITTTSSGLRYRTQEGSASASHVDHTLATLAEIGLPLDYPILARRDQSELRVLVEQALQRFSLNQREYEWTAILLGLYATDNSPWVSMEGQEITFDRVAQRIMRQEYGQGICYGGHRLFTLVMLRRIDIDDQRLFSDSTRAEIDEHLTEATRRLVQTQSVEGYWDRTWPGHSISEIKQLWPLGSRFLATSHAMEWWALAPDHVLPPRENLVRAGQWMVRELEKMDEVTVRKNYTFLTHAGRSLAMWRGGFPHELYSDSNESTALNEQINLIMK